MKRIFRVIVSIFSAILFAVRQSRQAHKLGAHRSFNFNYFLKVFYGKVKFGDESHQDIQEDYVMRGGNKHDSKSTYLVSSTRATKGKSSKRRGN